MSTKYSTAATGRQLLPSTLLLREGAELPEMLRPYARSLNGFFRGPWVKGFNKPYALPFRPWPDPIETADFVYLPETPEYWWIDREKEETCIAPYNLKCQPLPDEVRDWLRPFAFASFRELADERLPGAALQLARTRGEDPAEDRAAHVRRLFDVLWDGESVVLVPPPGYLAFRFEPKEGREDEEAPTLLRELTGPLALEGESEVTFFKYTRRGTVLDELVRPGTVYSFRDGELQVWATGNMLPIRVLSIGSLFDFHPDRFADALGADLEDQVQLALVTKRRGSFPVAAEAGRGRIRFGPLATAEPVARQWIVPGVYGAGDKVLIATQPSVGKTTHALEEAACMAVGRSVFGSGRFSPVRSIVIESEASSNLDARRAAAAARHPELVVSDVLFSIGRVALDDPAAVSDFIEDTLATVPLGVDMKPLGAISFGIAADHMFGSEAQLDTWAKVKAGLDRIQDAIAEGQGGLRPRVVLYQHPNRKGESLAGSIGQERFFDTVLRCPSKPKQLAAGSWVEYRLAVDKAREGFSATERPTFWMGLAEVDGVVAPVASLVEPEAVEAAPVEAVEVVVEDDARPGIVRLFDEVEAAGYARLDDLRAEYLRTAGPCSDSGRGTCSGSTLRCERHRSAFRRLRQEAVEAGLLDDAPDDRGLVRLPAEG